MQFGVTRRDAASGIAKPLYPSRRSRVRIPLSPPGSKFECCTNVFAQDLSPIFRSALVRVTRCASQFFHCLAELSANRPSPWVGSVSRWACLLNKPACWGRHFKRPRSERTGARIRAFLHTSVSASLLYHIEFADKIITSAPMAKFACSLRNTLPKSVRATCGNGAF